jgi:NAD(P)-dependent dehydrogenase (short-subunit alcohol dehydrogenase family)
MQKTSSASVAVVTGGSRGLGLEIARRLVADGFVVSLWDLDGVRLDEARTQLGA